MKAFAFNLFARAPDGRQQPLRGRVSAPEPAGDAGYVCRFDCSLFGGGQFQSVWPEWTYARAICFIRDELEPSGLEPCDAGGRPIELMPPVVDDYGIPCFAEARFRGRSLHKGTWTDFTAAVHAPERDPQRGWNCPVACSLYDIRSPIHSDWPDHAYQLAFAFLRILLAHDAPATTMTGEPLLLCAPVRRPRRH